MKTILLVISLCVFSNPTFAANCVGGKCALKSKPVIVQNSTQKVVTKKYTCKNGKCNIRK